jgi:hypothetical protein
MFQLQSKKEEVKMEHKHTKRKKSGNTKEKVEILLFYIKDP